MQAVADQKEGQILIVVGAIPPKFMSKVYRTMESQIYADLVPITGHYSHTHMHALVMNIELLYTVLLCGKHI